MLRLISTYQNKPVSNCLYAKKKVQLKFIFSQEKNVVKVKYMAKVKSCSSNTVTTKSVLIEEHYVIKNLKYLN